MPWQEASVMCMRSEFVRLAEREGANIRELCRPLTLPTRPRIVDCTPTQGVWVWEGKHDRCD